MAIYYQQSEKIGLKSSSIFVEGTNIISTQEKIEDILLIQALKMKLVMNYFWIGKNVKFTNANSKVSLSRIYNPNKKSGTIIIGNLTIIKEDEISYMANATQKVERTFFF